MKTEDGKNIISKKRRNLLKAWKLKLVIFKENATKFTDSQSNPITEVVVKLRKERK